MSPLSLLCHAVRRPAADSASSWQGGGGVRPPSLACGAALGLGPGPVPADVYAVSLMAYPAPQGCAPPLAMPPSAGPVRWPWMPGMSSGTAVPHPPAHSCTGRTLSVLVCRADPQAG